jgi:hypothetical protein
LEKLNNCLTKQALQIDNGKIVYCTWVPSIYIVGMFSRVATKKYRIPVYYFAKCLNIEHWALFMVWWTGHLDHTVNCKTFLMIQKMDCTVNDKWSTSNLYLEQRNSTRVKRANGNRTNSLIVSNRCNIDWQRNIRWDNNSTEPHSTRKLSINYSNRRLYMLFQVLYQSLTICL